MKYKYDFCLYCDVWYLECKHCGNNTCNGGYGKNGNCPECPQAHADWRNNVDYPSAEKRLKNLSRDFPDVFAEFTQVYCGNNMADLFEQYLVEHKNFQQDNLHAKI